MLKEAYGISPDVIAYNLFTRGVVNELMTTGEATVHDEAHDLTRKIGLIPAV